MSAVMIDGSPLRVTQFRRGRDIQVGEKVRADDGTLRSSVRGVKRTWNGETPQLTPAEHTNALGQLSPLSSHTLTGDAVGGTFTVAAEHDDDQARPNAADIERVVRFRLEEV